MNLCGSLFICALASVNSVSLLPLAFQHEMPVYIHTILHSGKLCHFFGPFKFEGCVIMCYLLSKIDMA